MNLVHMSRLDLNLFVVLEAIHAEGSITGAAARLNLTQPAISHALRRLRDTFDDPLFVRQGNRMVPTALARSVIEPVRQSVHTLIESVQGVRSFDPASAQRNFTIGCRDVMEAHLLRPLMMRLAREAPGVGISSVRIDRNDLEANLANGDVDLAVEVLTRTPDSVRRLPIIRDSLVVVARRDHPALAGELDLPAYLAQEHILVSSRPKGMSLEDIELARIGHQRRIALRCQQYFAASMLVAETGYLLTMPERYARIVNRGLPTRIVDFPVPAPPLHVYLYWHENAGPDLGNAWLRALVAEIAQQDHAVEA